MENIEDDLKHKIRSFRKKSGLSQVALANRADVSVQTIKDIEAGRRGAGIKALQGISDALGVSIEDLTSSSLELPVVKVEKFKARKALRYFEKIPDDIYDLAMAFQPSDDVWDEVKLILEDAKLRLERKKSDKARA